MFWRREKLLVPAGNRCPDLAALKKKFILFILKIGRTGRFNLVCCLKSYSVFKFNPLALELDI
jgi:hypothetical protein